MKLTLRVGNSIADLSQIHRVSVESIGTRSFLVGIRQSGNLMALYAVRPHVAPSEVLDAIERALASGRGICPLHKELVEIGSDPQSVACLDTHNASVLENERVGLPHTTAGRLVDAH